MAQLPRGITPDLLLSQVKNTMPYLFEEGAESTALSSFPPAKVAIEMDARLAADEDPKAAAAALTHFEYYRLCLSAHYLTVGTPVPTDVDNQIRLKLWPKKLPIETALEMTDLILDSRHWDFTLVSTRYIHGAAGTPWEKETVSGHRGEWFTVASAAYCALGQYLDPGASEKRQKIFDAIRDEVHRHSEIFGSLWRAGDGLGALKASASIAHNTGDLDRVMDMWNLPVEDPLRLEYYRLGVSPFDPNGKLRYLGRLWVAGELYKSLIGPPSGASSMAFENHRHFALRKPRALRQSSAFLIPAGPFFDDWGRSVARGLSSGGRPTDATLEVLEALKHGWERLPKTVGYGRALRGMLEVHSELSTGESLQELRKEHPFRMALDQSQAVFEKTWAEEALRLMDEIPSRA